jgi:hypothetical protein|tara:strand:- start:158 stop:301 length:144 start_codon:yes stop_codon:yes gene_type:complete
VATFGQLELYVCKLPGKPGKAGGADRVGGRVVGQLQKVVGVGLQVVR